MINEHVSNWLGYPVKDYAEQKAPKPASTFMQKLGLTKSTPVATVTSFPPIEDGDRVIYRLSRDWESKVGFDEQFRTFLSNPSVKNAPAVIIGAWMGDAHDLNSATAVHALAEANAQLPLVKGIFVGDILSEETEISWINQSDLSILLTAYPRLEHLRIRGGTGLRLAQLTGHEHLRSLIIESGGLASETVRDVMALNLPALEHLELWLGTEDYGGDSKVGDLAPLMSGTIFPKLRRLGLRDAEKADEVAAALAKSPLLNRLTELDLSLGTLSDVGAQSLLDCEALARLRSLDLHHHYCSKEMVAKLRKAFPGVDLSDPQESDGEYRYVAVGE